MTKPEPHISIPSDQIPESCHMKGTAVKSLKSYLDAKLGSGFFKEKAREYHLSQDNVIISSRWYPLKSFIEIQKAGAKALQISDREFGIDSARHILEVDLNGVYKLFMRVGGPEFVISKLPKMTSSYTDFIQLVIEENKPGNAVASFTIPSTLAEWYSISTEGGAIGVLNVCKKPLKTFRVTAKETVDKQLAKWTFQMCY